MAADRRVGDGWTRQDVNFLDSDETSTSVHRSLGGKVTCHLDSTLVGLRDDKMKPCYYPALRCSQVTHSSPRSGNTTLGDKGSDAMIVSCCRYSFVCIPGTGVTMV